MRDMLRIVNALINDNHYIQFGVTFLKLKQIIIFVSKSVFLESQTFSQNTRPNIDQFIESVLQVKIILTDQIVATVVGIGGYSICIDNIRKKFKSFNSILID